MTNTERRDAEMRSIMNAVAPKAKKEEKKPAKKTSKKAGKK